MTLKWAERYEERKILGEGGSGIVYLAYDALCDREVAVKEYKKEDSAVQEIYILKRLEHPQIPRVLEVGRRERKRFFVMPYIEGESFGYLLEKRKVKVRDKIAFGIQICDIFSYLHTQTPPIIYRDLKPDNLILTADKKLVLIDFGAARYYKPFQREDTMLLGTKGFAAPEQFGGRGQSDARTDIYTIGRFFFWLFEEEISKEENNNLYIKLLRRMIEICTKTEREKRYYSVLEVQNALKQIKKIYQVGEMGKKLVFFAIFSLFGFVSYQKLDFYLYEVRVQKIREEGKWRDCIEGEFDWLEDSIYLSEDEIGLYREMLSWGMSQGLEEEIETISFIHRRLQNARRVDWEAENLREILYKVGRESFQIFILDKREVLSKEELERYLEKSSFGSATSYQTIADILWSSREEREEVMKKALDSIWISVEKMEETREKCRGWMTVIELYRLLDRQEERGLQLIEEIQGEVGKLKREEAVKYQIYLYEVAIQFLEKIEKTADEKEQRVCLQREVEYTRKLEKLEEKEERIKWKKRKLSLLEILLVKKWIVGDEEEIKKEIEEEYSLIFREVPQDRQAYLQYALYLLHVQEDVSRAEYFFEKASKMEGGEEEFFILQEELQEWRQYGGGDGF